MPPVFRTSPFIVYFICATSVITLLESEVIKRKATKIVATKVEETISVGGTDITPYGEMPEWMKGAVLKTEEQKCSVGSNPTLSAKGCYKAIYKGIYQVGAARLFFNA